MTLALSVGASARISSDFTTDGKLTVGGPLYGLRRPNEILTAEENTETAILSLEAEEWHGYRESESSPDIGVLRGGTSRALQHGNMHYSEGNYHDYDHHFLQSSTTDTYSNNYDAGSMCGESCKPSTCVCMTNIFLETSDVGCATEVDAVCNGVTDADGTKWNIQGCIIGYPYGDSSDVLCSVAKCRVNGGSFASCWAQPFYEPPSVDSSQEMSDEQPPSSNGNIITSDCRVVGAAFSIAAAAVAWSVLN